MEIPHQDATPVCFEMATAFSELSRIKTEEPKRGGSVECADDDAGLKRHIWASDSLLSVKVLLPKGAKMNCCLENHL